jgi:hypothetical protein
MGKNEFKNYICEPFCAFYRSGLKEELACAGALLLEDLLTNRKLSPEILSLMKKERRSAARRNSTLDMTVCAGCDFIGDGCDFQSVVKLPDAEPCGGYRLLDLLMAKGLIPRDEPENKNDP